ncbi:PREDICTED: myosin-3-like [Populus euphratica]|uniref:Myosin-3-like n=1 Tax=Populus euphratica TaxID=75702 RepID=A0AAJ6UKZ8_POPEU|nr:PREDICTED: myosin-3-like [Populus euphratica]
MQQDKEQVEGELRNLKQRLDVAERERDRARDELKEMKKVADESNSRLKEAMSNGKVADIFVELNSVVESLSKSKQELKIKELAITSLKAEVGKLREAEAKLLEKDNSLEKLNKELSNVKSTEARTLDLLSHSKKRIQELEAEVQKGNEAETKLLDSFAAQTKQLEQTKILLEESKLEITSLRKQVEELEKHDGDKVSLQKELESLKSELHLERQNRTHAQEGGEKHSASKTKSLLEEMELLKRELKLANEAEENSKKAMDGLAMALTEVATESTQTREKLKLTQEGLERFKKEAEILQENINSLEDKYRTLLNEERKEADRYRKTTERLQIEAEESLLAWNAKETGFVDCIKRAEDEKSDACEENNKLLELLRTAENMNKIAKQENQKVRDILKQALNEANVAKEAAGIARDENSQLKDVLAEKDNALVFITQENENLRINEAATLEQIKELKQFVCEASERELKVEDKENQLKEKPQNAEEKQDKDGKKLGRTCSFSLKELIIPNKHKDVDGNNKTIDKQKNKDEDEDSENRDLLRGSKFDKQAESPTVAVPRKEKITNVGEETKPRDYDHIDGAHTNDPESEKNSTRKRAYIRRFGDILLRRGGSHRRGQSVGGD